jgi:ribosomal protein L37AE/L43A
MIIKNEYPIEYTGEDCPKCGRMRVELWSNGERICEKCNWNLDKKEYKQDDI